MAESIVEIGFDHRHRKGRQQAKQQGSRNLHFLYELKYEQKEIASLAANRTESPLSVDVESHSQDSIEDLLPSRRFSLP